MRNLKLGDNLSGKTLYFNFPETFQDFLNNGYSPATVNLFTTDSGYSFDAVLSQNGGSLQYQVICMENGSIYKNIERVYINSDAYGLEMNASSVNLPDDFGKVISIDSTTNFIQNIQIDPKIVIIVDTQPKSSPSENKKEYILYTEELNSNGDISDLLEINYNKVKLTRKIGIDENGNKYVLEEPIIEEFELEIVLFKGNNYIYVEETDYSKLTLEYYTDNPANEEFARVKEVEALIKVTDEINSQVKKKVDDTEVVSVINQSAEQITIKGNRFVVESTNFKLTEEGLMTVFNAILNNIKIKSGTIELGDDSVNGNMTLVSVDGKHRNTLVSSFITLLNSLENSQVTISDSGSIILRNSNGQVSLSPSQFVCPGNAIFEDGIRVGSSTNTNIESIENITNISFVQHETPYYLEITNPILGAYGIDMWASDKRLKKNIKNSNYNALSQVMKIKHREFDYKDGKHVKLGYIADELEEIDEELIYKVGNEKMRHPAKNYLIPLLSKAIQEQQEMIESLKRELEVLKNETI